MRRWTVALAGACACLLSVSLAGAQVSRGEIEEGIDQGVKLILSKQAEDGHWAYFTTFETGESKVQAVGHTALAVLALQHSGSRNPEVATAIKKGIEFILQQPPEARTYSAGVVEQVLYTEDPRKYRVPMSVYAWMLVSGQKLTGSIMGSWNYELPKPPGDWQKNGLRGYAAPVGSFRSDNSNSQFAILGLVYADRSGYQIPRAVWGRARDYWVRTQWQNGGWDYQSEAFRREVPAGAENWRRATMAMTLAGTVSTALCTEMLSDRSHRKCEVPADDPVHENGLKWVAKAWQYPKDGPYTWYGAERLGILIGYSEFGGRDWYEEGARDILARWVGQDVAFNWGLSHMGPVVDNSFSVLFLARGRTPIIINKLKRAGDWNLHRYDLKNLTEQLTTVWQTPCQWRIVGLDVSTSYLLKVPMLWISGHDALIFTPAEKAKLKAYVEGGGTILGDACCGKKAFDESFRALAAELWPGSELTELAKNHAIYTNYRKLDYRPKLMGMTMGGQEGRFGVIYFPEGVSCKWEVGGGGASGALDVGACIYLYVNRTWGVAREEEVETRPAVEPRPAPAGKETPVGGGDGFGNEEP